MLNLISSLKPDISRNVWLDTRYLARLDTKFDIRPDIRYLAMLNAEFNIQLETRYI